MPWISKFSFGVSVPIPILPSDKIVNFSSDTVPFASGVPRPIPILELSRGAIDQKSVDPAFLFCSKR